MDQAVYEWLLSCPQLRELSYQFGAVQDQSTLLLYDNETLLQFFNDGSSDRMAVYQVAPFACFSDAAQDNIEQMTAIRSIRSWVDACDAAQVYPEFPGIYKVETGDVSISQASAPNRLAKYQFPLKIYYMEE